MKRNDMIGGTYRVARQFCAVLVQKLQNFAEIRRKNEFYL